MATRIELFPVARRTVPSRIPGLSALIRLLLLLVISLSAISPARAQTSSQQYVYLSLPGSVPGSPSSLTSGFAKASQTGALNSIAGSPFADRLEGGLVAMDGQGRFLFVLNPKSNDISMFQVDQVSGALSEVPGSPFAVPPTVNPSMAPSQPISIATEASGKFLFVGYLVGDFQGASAVVSLVIDTSGSSPVLITPQSTEINNGGAPIQSIPPRAPWVSRARRIPCRNSGNPTRWIHAVVFSLRADTVQLVSSRVASSRPWTVRRTPACPCSS